jgi:hypothetical protein
MARRIWRRSILPRGTGLNLFRLCNSYKSSFARTPFGWPQIGPAARVLLKFEGRATGMPRPVLAGWHPAHISNAFSTSAGAGSYFSGSIDAPARPWLRLRIALE